MIPSQHFGFIWYVIYGLTVFVWYMACMIRIYIMARARSSKFSNHSNSRWHSNSRCPLALWARCWLSDAKTTAGNAGSFPSSNHDLSLWSLKRARLGDYRTKLTQIETGAHQSKSTWNSPWVLHITLSMPGRKVAAMMRLGRVELRSKNKLDFFALTLISLR